MTPLRPSRAEIRRDLAAIVAGTGLLFFLALGAKDLWNPNEPVYGQAVAEMAARGDWLLPTVNGRVFAEKPILYYWMALAASRVLGSVSELALRVPSALAGVVGAVLLYLLAEPYAGRTRARIAVALYATTFAVFWCARTAQMDVLVMTTTLGVVAAVSRVVDHGLRPALGWTLAGVAAGLGLLSKAAVGLAVPAMVLAAYLTATRGWHRLRDARILFAVAAAIAVAGPWFAWLLATGKTDFLRELLYRQHFTRFVDPWDHERPWWYYLRYLWIDMAPWAWFLPLAVGLPSRDADERRLDVLAWSWIAAPLVLFSLSASKRSAYILPVAPAIAVVASGVAERFLAARLGKPRTRAALLLLAACGVVALVAAIVLWLRIPHYPDLATRIRAVSMLLATGGACVVAGVVVFRSVRPAAATALYSMIVVLYALTAVAVLPAVDARKSARPFCERVAAVVPPEVTLRSFGFWEWRAGYTFYLRRPIPNLETARELSAWWRGDERVCVIVESTHVEALRSVVGGVSRPWVEAPVGSRTAYLFCNHRPPGSGPASSQ
jgi:4-amino-4-deoxy-L-arabinose transferase-like glycosyltransferase